MTQDCLSQLLVTPAVTTGLLVAELRCAAEPGADFYRPRNGSDKLPGTPSELTGEDTTAPFATRTRPRDARRESARKHSGDVMVLTPAATDHLKKTVVCGLQNSGRDTRATTDAAYHGEAHLFSSSPEIGGRKTRITPPPEVSKEAAGKPQAAVVNFAGSQIRKNRGNS